jgi:HlyD family secretion protein
VKKLLIVLVVLFLALVGVAIGFGSQLREKLSKLTPEPASTAVRTEPAARRTIIESIQAPGRIEPLTQVEIAAEVSARIVDLPVREGQSVRKGDLVCKLDDKDLRALLVSAQARRDGQRFQLQADETRLDGLAKNRAFADKELKRMQSLHETGDVTMRDLDAALERVQDLETSIEATRFAISVGETAIQSAEADIERAQDGLDNSVILAPMGGKITLLNVEVGEIVTGSTTNPGTRLMTIADLSRMVHKSEVAESDVARVEIGQRAKLHINAYPDEIFGGTVRQIAWQRSDSPNGTGYFETEVEIDLQGREIRSGLIANVDIEIAAHEGIVIPYQAIVVRDIQDLPEEVRQNDLIDRTRTKASVVYCVVDGAATCTPVKGGASDLTHRLVLAGLADDDEVIVGPYKVLEAIKHGDRVKREEEPATKKDGAPEAVASEGTAADEKDGATAGTNGE